MKGDTYRWQLVTNDLPLTDPPARTLDDDVWSDEVRSSLKPILSVEDTTISHSDSVSTVLITGPTNAGKSYLAESLAGTIGYPVCRVSSLDEGYDVAPGPTSKVVDDIESARPCTVLYDTLLILERRSTEPHRIDTLVRSVERLREMEDVVLIATARKLTALPDRLKHPGVFDILCPLAYPDEARRAHLLDEFLNTVDIPVQLTDKDRDEIVTESEGYSPEDIHTTIRRAVGYARFDAEPILTKSAIDRALSTLARDLDFQQAPETSMFGEAEYDTYYAYDENLTIEEDSDGEPVEFTLFNDEDDDQEKPHIAIQRLDTVPEVSYDDIGGLSDAKRILKETIEWPREHPELCASLDIDTAKGILLHGPPGNGKTMLAKAIANETESRFISVKGPEVLDKYVGEAQRFVDTLFETARDLSPAVIFIDEIDSITDNRGGTGPETVTDDVVNQLLLELDGLDELSDIVVIGATNRPDMIDSAVLRPGRLGKKIHIPLPDEEGKSDIFEVHTKDRPIAEEVSTDWLVNEAPEEISGAGIASICESASRAALRRNLAADESIETPTSDEIRITRQDFERVLSERQPTDDHAGPSGFQ